MDLTPALLARVALGVIGLAVLVRGAAIYRPALWFSAFSAGAVAVVALAPEGADPRVLAGIALLTGLASVAITTWVHRIGLVVIGAVVGGTIAFAAGTWLGAPPWAVPVGGLAGAVAMPFVFDRALPFTTPAVGAVLVATAADRGDNLLVIAVLYLVGVAAQARSREGEE